MYHAPPPSMYGSVAPPYAGYGAPATGPAAPAAPVPVAQAASGPQAIDTQHEDIVHDAQLDYYGRRLATASSDRTVRVFEVAAGAAPATSPSAVLRGHEGPVWQVAWAHPRFGTLLASASYDGRVIVWKEDEAGAPRGEAGRWVRAKEHRAEAGVNAVSWSSGGDLALACALADGRVVVLTYDGSAWAVETLQAHQVSANAVTWSSDGSLLATAGSDNLVRLWTRGADGALAPLCDPLAGHSDWVRDVAFVTGDALLSVSQDRTALVWRPNHAKTYAPTPLPAPTENGFADTLWRISAAPHGGLVGVACGDGRVHLYRATGDASGCGYAHVSDVDSSTGRPHAA